MQSKHKRWHNNVESISDKSGTGERDGEEGLVGEGGEEGEEEGEEGRGEGEEEEKEKGEEEG